MYCNCRFWNPPDVTSVSPRGVAGPAPEVSALPHKQLPAPAVSATAGDHQVALSWNGNTGATEYVIYRGTSPGGESSHGIVTVTATTYTNTGLTNGTTYYYTLEGTSESGWSNLSKEVSATPKLPAKPAAPEGLAVKAGDAQVDLDWTASSGATSYNVYRGTSTGGEAATPIATGITTTGFTNSGLTNGKTYYYKVAAVNAGGTSPLSDEASATPKLPLPPAPVGLKATAANTVVRLAWMAAATAASYSIYRGTSSNDEAATAITTGVKTSTYTDIGLTNGTTYYFKVAAVNAAGTSPLSNEASATPKLTPPLAPQGLTAKAGAVQVTLSWTASSTATSYSVFRGAASHDESATPVAAGLTVTSYINTGLTAGVAYYYTVAARNAAGQSPESAEVMATPTFPVLAPPPTGLTATAGSAEVTLSWKASSGATSYNIYRGTSSGNETSTVATGVAKTTYTNAGLTNGTTYYFIVAAVNSVGTSTQSNEVSATPKAATASLMTAPALTAVATGTPCRSGCAQGSVLGFAQADKAHAGAPSWRDSFPEGVMALPFRCAPRQDSARGSVAPHPERCG